MLIEEARSMVNWDSIKDYMRLEGHYRVTNDTSPSTNPLKNLTKEEFAVLQLNYEKYTPYIRGLFISITLLNILWDFMLFWTICYYHVMLEKLLGGLFAVLTWFITYKLWYPSNYLPKLPGNGVFKYIKPKPVQNTPINLKRRTGGNGNKPMFMGRPLNTGRSESVNNSDDQQR
ncbi:PREDICTED: FIT family protein CG10671 [Nicrophorus vespilloides]|uniref:FIT family protein CG10671 n=1 Tax=Nicrophorus vespilloides TaxID=110193 RepID=A0ABM1N6V1_NICVS|nr:PREDICTED: FIT family protein CG10671 [Nicrophorus vespilloides]